ncbi:MAG: ABC transporter ATP-binding protein [Candidatus ainarchaeum sp.]|nr:ABC transporter ATP-binding protein [Candidatus ainarchaeum sp.]
MEKGKKETVLELKGVSFSYGKNSVLDKISLAVERGDFVGMIGPNGAGKTTLLKIILGLLKPDSGSVSVFGKSLSEFNAPYRIGYVPQKATNFDPNFPASVFEIASMGRFSRIGPARSLAKDDVRKIEQALDFVGMLPYRDARIGDLSGGQQQRVFIARALAGDSELLLLDEPTISVDSESQKRFYSLLRKLNRELRMTCIIVSHDVTMINGLVNRLLCVNHTAIIHDVSNGIKEEDLCCPYDREMTLVSHRHEHSHG